MSVVDGKRSAFGLKKHAKNSRMDRALYRAVFLWAAGVNSAVVRAAKFNNEIMDAVNWVWRQRIFFQQKLPYPGFLVVVHIGK